MPSTGRGPDLLLQASHEFRTPLTIVLGHAATLFHDAQGMNEESRARLAAVQRNAFRLLKSVETMIELSRVSAGVRLARFEPVDLVASTQDVCAAFAGAVEAAGLSLRVDVPGAPLKALVDRTMWLMAALHLLSNAFKHSFHGPIDVSLRREGDRAVLSVRDRGDGFSGSADRQVKTRSRDGAGLGLLFAERVAELHGGSLQKSEAEGGGTVSFSVSLGEAHAPKDRTFPPRPQPAEAVARPFLEEALLWLPGDAAQAVPPPEGGFNRVLVVDANGEMRRYLAGVLSSSWDVETADSCAAAVERIHGKAPDVVVADAATCRDDQTDLVKAIRQDARTHRLPVLILTATAGEEETAVLEAGADGTLPKPFTARELHARVAAQLGAARSRALAEAHRTQLYALFQQAPAAICVLRGPDHVFEMANTRFEQIHRGTQKLTGRTFRAALPEIADEAVFDVLDRVYRTGEPYVGREQHAHIDRRGDGVTDDAWFTFVYQPMRDLSGRVEGVMLFGFEVTESVRARQQIERLVAQARENDRRKDEFLAMLAHELRNPLAPLRTSLELIRRGQAQGPDLARHLEVVERQSENLARIVDDLLDVSRITRGKIELRREPLDVSAVVARAVEATRGLIESRRHALTVRLADAPVRVLADDVRLEQVLVNLLTNAAKYTDPHGRIDVSVALAGGAVEMRVKDSGHGIPREMLAKVFDLFTQAERGLDRAQGGLGIGLTIVRNLVTMHGGTVEALSEGRGKGSEFVVRIPALPADAAPAEEPQARPIAPRQPPQQPGPSGSVRRRVLLVDDNVDAAETLAEFLDVLGHDVRIAHDGVAALRMAQEAVPELVLLDIGLPGMDGYQVARELRKLPEPPGVVVALSGYGQEGDRKKSAEAGFDAHLVKPVELSKLEQLLADPPSRK